jgi:hypothetical protein
MLDRAIGGHGCVAGVVGPPGIGKSRIVAETAAIAARRGVAVFSAYCESHAAEVPFYAVARLLRVAFGSRDSTMMAPRGMWCAPRSPRPTLPIWCFSTTRWVSETPRLTCLKSPRMPGGDD